MAKGIRPLAPHTGSVGTKQHPYKLACADKLVVSGATLYVAKNAAGEPELRLIDGEDEYIVSLSPSAYSNMSVYLSNGEFYTVKWLRANPDYVEESNLALATVAGQMSGIPAMTARLDLEQMAITTSDGKMYVTAASGGKPASWCTVNGTEGVSPNDMDTTLAEVPDATVTSLYTPLKTVSRVPLAYRDAGGLWHIKPPNMTMYGKEHTVVERYGSTYDYRYNNNQHGEFGCNLGLTWAQFAALDHDHWATVTRTKVSQYPSYTVTPHNSDTYFTCTGVSGNPMRAVFVSTPKAEVSDAERCVAVPAEMLPDGYVFRVGPSLTISVPVNCNIDGVAADNGLYAMRYSDIDQTRCNVYEDGFVQSKDAEVLEQEDGTFRNQAGQRVNKWGQLVNEDGDLLDENGEAYPVLYNTVLTPAAGSYQQQIACLENVWRKADNKYPLWRQVKKNGSLVDFMDGADYTVIDMSRYPFPAGSEIRKIVFGDNFSAWLLTDGTLWTCGANTHGQLGIGDDRDWDLLQIFPVQVGIDPVYDISAAGESLAVLLSDGRLGVCGANHYGQLGTGDKADRRDIVQIDEDVETMEMYAANLVYRKGGALLATGYNCDGRFEGLPAWLS